MEKPTFDTTRFVMARVFRAVAADDLRTEILILDDVQYEGPELRDAWRVQEEIERHIDDAREQQLDVALDELSLLIRDYLVGRGQERFLAEAAARLWAVKSAKWFAEEQELPGLRCGPRVEDVNGYFVPAVWDRDAGICVTLGKGLHSYGEALKEAREMANRTNCVVRQKTMPAIRL